MKLKNILALIVIATAATCVNAQKGPKTTGTSEKAQLLENRKEALREKLEMRSAASAPTVELVSSPLNDADSFGKNVKFLGSLYAGTVYVYHSCDPAVFEAEMGVPFAPDDKCVAYTPNTSGSTFEFYDPAWEFTIPANAVDNVIYPLLNNSIGFDSFS